MDNATHPVLNYTIYRNDTYLATIGSNTTFFDIGLINEYNYTYTVRAVDERGEGAPSNDVGVTPHSCCVWEPSQEI